MSHEDELAELEELARRELRRLHADALRGPRPGVEGRILAGLDYRPRPGLRRPWLAAPLAAVLGAMAGPRRARCARRWGGPRLAQHALPPAARQPFGTDCAPADGLC